MGGAACLYVASKLEVPAVVTVAAPVRSRQIRASSAKEHPDPRAAALMQKQGLHFDLSPGLPRIRNILVFHGEADRTVPFKNALEIEKAAKAPKRLIRLKGGDHRMSDPAHQAVFLQEAPRWFAETAGSLPHIGPEARKRKTQG